jgi:hypothetical protein
VKEVFYVYLFLTYILCEPASSPMGTGAFFPGVKQPGHEADHSPPSSAEVKNDGAVPQLCHMFSWHGA